MTNAINKPRYRVGDEIYYCHRVYMGGEQIYYGKSVVTRVNAINVFFEAKFPFGKVVIYIPLSTQRSKINSIYDLTIQDQELLKQKFEAQLPSNSIRQN